MEGKNTVLETALSCVVGTLAVTAMRLRKYMDLYPIVCFNLKVDKREQMQARMNTYTRC